MKILVIENDVFLVKKIKNFLRTEGHTFKIYPSATPALTAVANDYYDCIIFNLTSLDQGKFHLLKFLRSYWLKRKTILTYEHNNVVTENKVLALELANLQKPYTINALHLKINAVTNYENTADNQAIFFNELIIDLQGRVVRVKGRLVNLTRLEYNLLLFFITNKNSLLDKNSIAGHLVREAAEPADFGALYAHIKNLKKKLTAAGCTNYIKTVYGFGYRFEA